MKEGSVFHWFSLSAINTKQVHWKQKQGTGRTGSSAGRHRPVTLRTSPAWALRSWPFFMKPCAPAELTISARPPRPASALGYHIPKDTVVFVPTSPWIMTGKVVEPRGLWPNPILGQGWPHQQGLASSVTLFSVGKRVIGKRFLRCSCFSSSPSWLTNAISRPIQTSLQNGF